MSKTIKTINLLNKRANGEKLPQKIKYLDEYYTLYEEAESIENLYLLDGVRVGWFNHANFRLNTAVEIIEDEQEMDIQSIKEIDATIFNNPNLKDATKATINLLVQAVKYLDNKLKEK